MSDQARQDSFLLPIASVLGQFGHRINELLLSENGLDRFPDKYQRVFAVHASHAISKTLFLYRRAIETGVR